MLCGGDRRAASRNLERMSASTSWVSCLQPRLGLVHRIQRAHATRDPPQVSNTREHAYHSTSNRQRRLIPPGNRFDLRGRSYVNRRSPGLATFPQEPPAPTLPCVSHTSRHPACKRRLAPRHPSERNGTRQIQALSPPSENESGRSIGSGRHITTSPARPTAGPSHPQHHRYCLSCNSHPPLPAGHRWTPVRPVRQGGQAGSSPQTSRTSPAALHH